MGEILLIALLLACLLTLIYMVSSASVQLFALSDQAEREQAETGGKGRRFWDVLSRDPRDVLLAAEFFRSLMFVMIVAAVIWAVPRWCGRLGWPILPGVVGALLVAWFLRALCGDILPKRAIGAEVERYITAQLFLLVVIWWMFRPLLWLTDRIVRWRPAAKRPAEREEIVERAIDTLAESVGMSEPVIEPDERAMIQGVIGLEDTEAREVMVPRIDIIAVDVHASIEDVRRRTAEFGHSRLPVYDGNLDSIVGVLYVKDLFCAPGGGSGDLGSLVRRAFVVPETKKVDALLEEFKRRRTHIAIVVDEFGGTAGLVTLEDILEEIVGEIEDEHDRKRRRLEQVSDDVLYADGVVPLEDIAEALHVELPDERFETIGGLIYDRVGGVPKVSQSFEEHGLVITIEQMDGQRIRRVQVRRQPQPLA